MMLTAVILAAVAVLLSGIAALNTHQQARATRETAAIKAERERLMKKFASAQATGQPTVLRSWSSIIGFQVDGHVYRPDQVKIIYRPTA